jgi:hypothetical protein
MLCSLDLNFEVFYAESLRSSFVSKNSMQTYLLLVSIRGCLNSHEVNFLPDAPKTSITSFCLVEVPIIFLPFRSVTSSDTSSPGSLESHLAILLPQSVVCH